MLHCATRVCTSSVRHSALALALSAAALNLAGHHLSLMPAQEASDLSGYHLELELLVECRLRRHQQEEEQLAPAEDEEEDEDEVESEYETDSEEEGFGRALLKPVFVPKVRP